MGRREKSEGERVVVLFKKFVLDTFERGKLAFYTNFNFANLAANPNLILREASSTILQLQQPFLTLASTSLLENNKFND